MTALDPACAEAGVAISVGIGTRPDCAKDGQFPGNSAEAASVGLGWVQDGHRMRAGDSVPGVDGLRQPRLMIACKSSITS
jgi:hypothetical protein